MKVAIYARVSTLDQDPEMQLRELREYCARRDKWEVFAEYVDRGVSGAKDSRPALDEMIHAATARRFKVVLVWKFDRFARSVQHLLESLKHFQSLGIDFVSVTESIDTTTPMGRMVFTFLAAIAEFERALIQERIRAGVQNARAKGKRLGRPRGSLDGEKLKAMRQNGKSWAEIKNLTGISRTSANRAIKGVSKIIPKVL